MKIRPLGERVVLKQLKGEERTKSGIYLPESSKEKKQGVVVEVGITSEGHPIPLIKWYIVLYSGYGSEEIEFENEKLLIIDYKDIVAKVEK